MKQIKSYGNYIFYDDCLWKKHFAWKPVKVGTKIGWLKWFWKRHIVFGYPQLKTQYLPMVKENE